MEKFSKNQCSAEELEELKDYFTENPSEDVMPEVNSLLEKMERPPKMSAQAEQRIRGFLTKERIKRHGARSKYKTFHFLTIAAIFIGVLLLTYYSEELLQPSLDHYDRPEQDQITLQLEDGTLEIIENTQTKEIYNKKGVRVGTVQRNQLVYQPSEKLDSVVYNQVVVPYGKTLQLLLADGSTVHLNAGSKLRFPINFLPGENREVFLEGEAFFDIAPDPEHPFLVQVADLQVEVLGTEFNLSAYLEDPESNVVLVEGSVSMSVPSEETETQVMLSPGEKGVFKRDNQTIEVSEVSPSVYTSWINGELVFRNMPLDQILKRLERHYNVDIDNRLEIPEAETFNANFGNEPLEKVLEYFSQLYDLDYTIRKNKVIIQ